MNLSTQEIPILLILFNRPTNTQRVFEIIRIWQPKFLFISIDGPRSENFSDLFKIKEVTKIVSAIDWKCEVKFKSNSTNLGCKYAPSSAINWFFDQVEQGIILEDDCVPDPTFYEYCAQLLIYYYDNPRIMHIAGYSSPYQRFIKKDSSYYFSIYNFGWGWATWRRAWSKFDVEISQWPQLKQKQFLNSLLDSKDIPYWDEIFQKVYEKKFNSCWDYQWTLSCWINNGLSIHPIRNLIKNIGFNSDATHTKIDKHLSHETLPMQFPLNHPKEINQDYAIDKIIQSKIFNPSIIQRIKNRVINSFN